MLSANGEGLAAPVAEPAGRAGDLEIEVARLKRLVAELLLEKQMLQDLAQKKW